MSEKLERTTVALSTAIIRRVDAIAAARGTTRAAVVRDAVADYCDDLGRGRADPERLAMTTEYCQVALDMMLREKSPDRVKDVLAIVQGRMEKFHGAR